MPHIYRAPRLEWPQGRDLNEIVDEEFDPTEDDDDGDDDDDD